MPTPTRTNAAEIHAAAQQILEREGLAGLTMQAVADAVGVRAPSLYKRVESRDALVRHIAEQAAAELGRRLDAALAESNDAGDRIRAVATSARHFAHESPAAYGLLFGAIPDAARPPRSSLERASAAAIAAVGGIVGPEHALDAARTITAWVHGFVTMELAGAFRLGGDVDRAWEFGLARLVDALART